MTSLLKYYRKKIDEDTGTIIFEPVREEDIKICGKPLKVVIDILNALEMEKTYDLEMTMQNLSKYIEIYQEEQQKMQKQVLDNMFKNFE